MAYAENTSVPLERSVGEIVGLLKKAGAERIGQLDEGSRLSVFFSVHGRHIKFSIPLATDYQGPLKSGNGRAVDGEAVIRQQNNQKGRALLLVIKAKLESVTSNVETFEEAFLANIVLSGGETVYQRARPAIDAEYSTGVAAPFLLGGPSK